MQILHVYYYCILSYIVAASLFLLNCFEALVYPFRRVLQSIWFGRGVGSVSALGSVTFRQSPCIAYLAAFAYLSLCIFWTLLPHSDKHLASLVSLVLLLRALRIKMYHCTLQPR